MVLIEQLSGGFSRRAARPRRRLHQDNNVSIVAPLRYDTSNGALVCKIFYSGVIGDRNNRSDLPVWMFYAHLAPVIPEPAEDPAPAPVQAPVQAQRTAPSAEVGAEPAPAQGRSSPPAGPSPEPPRPSNENV